MAVLMAVIGLGALALIVLGLFADAWDPYGDERRDAMRRNHTGPGRRRS